jgi:hypothetical protein
MKLIEKKFVHKKKDENVLIYNMRRALPRKIYTDIFENVVLPSLSPEDSKFLQKYYSQEPFIYLLEQKPDEKPYYILHSLPHEIDAKFAVNILNTLKIQDKEQRELLHFFYRDKDRNLFVLRENISESDELLILKILKKFRTWHISDDKKAKLSEILEKSPVLPKEDVFFSNMFVNLTHPFFFEHSNEHVPAMMTIEAARQFLIACCHVYGNIPIKGISFIMSDMNIKFDNYLELNFPIKMVANLNNLKTRRLDSVTNARYWNEIDVTITIYQRNILAAEINFIGKSIKSDLFKTLRKDKYVYDQMPRFHPRYSNKNITLININNNKKLLCEIVDISYNGFQLKYEKSNDFFLDSSKEEELEFIIFFQEIGFIHGRCRRIWFHERIDNNYSGFFITNIEKDDIENLKESIKRYCYVIEDREYL